MKFPCTSFGLPIGIALAMLALAAAPVGVTAAASDKSSPSSQFLTAYNSMTTADWLNEKGMPADAADLYGEARNLFGKLAAEYPEWQPDVVAFRINYCRDALGRIERKAMNAGQAVPADSPAPKAESTAQNAEQRTKQQEPITSNVTMPSPLDLKLQQAAFKERGRDYTGALAVYTAILEEFPQETWALKGACRCCLRLGDMDRARALIRQTPTLPSPDAGLNLLAALVDCHDGRYQEAIPRLRQSLKQNGACPEAHAALGVALAAGGQMEEARQEMKRALSFNPKLGDAYYNLARLSLRQKPTDYDTARVHYQNALRHGSAPDPELDKLLAE